MLRDTVAVHKSAIATAKISQNKLAVHEFDLSMRPRGFGVFKVDLTMAIPAQTLLGFADQVMGAYVRTTYNQKGSQLSSTSLFERSIKSHLSPHYTYFCIA